MAQLSEGRMTYVPIEGGLRMCVDEFVKAGCECGAIWAFREAYFDKLSHAPAKLSELPGWKPKAKYLVTRYTPYLAYKRITSR